MWREVLDQGDLLPRRALDWSGLHNARDLGGLPAQHGVTRFGVVVRSENLDRLTSDGKQALIAYPVVNVIDIRSPAETALQPHALQTQPDYRHLPLLDDRAMEDVARIEAPAEAYRYMVDERAPQIAEILKALLTTPAGSSLIHCKAGKDRTGVVVALLLDNAGVDRHHIVGDYALSDRLLQPLYRIWAREEGVDLEAPEQIRRYASLPESMSDLLEHMTRKYGGTSDYLRAVGLSSAEVAGLAYLLHRPDR